MQSPSTLLIRCIRSELGQYSLADLFSEDELAFLVSDETARAVFAAASPQDLSHIPAAVFCKLQSRISDAMFASVKKVRFQTAFRCEQITHETQAVSGLFCASGIPHIPLKGAFIRPYYPSPDMRTSCDVDILVSTDDLRKAENALTEKLGYTKIRDGGHDVQFSSPTGVLLELHFTLMDEKDYPRISAVLSRVWENVRPSDEGSYKMVMSPSFAYFYHIAHMVKHYLYGGCGIRTLMDLWIFNHRIPGFDRGDAAELLAEAGILRFEEKVYSLAEMWFSGAECDFDDRELLSQMEEYIVSGGIYGSVENKLKLNRLDNPDQGAYLRSRLFPPFERMKYEYPVLQKHKILLPFCYLKRWGRLLSKNTAKKVSLELKHNSELTPEGQDKFRQMLTDLGLK
ncbi:MAG: nucleotidyltransferase family protein [Clostridia bacterium]|nr:nucleotidyltransferase family protein [Clostridia bacterium]